MKILFLPLLLLTCFAGSAQFAAFPTPGMEYGPIFVCNIYDSSSYFNTSMRYAGDDTLCGVTWNRFVWLPDLSGANYIRAEQGKLIVPTSN